MSQLTKKSSRIQVHVTMSHIKSGHQNLRKRQRTPCLSPGLEDSIPLSPSFKPWEAHPLCIRPEDLVLALVPTTPPACTTPCLTGNHCHQYWRYVPFIQHNGDRNNLRPFFFNLTPLVGSTYKNTSQNNSLHLTITLLLYYTSYYY